MNSRTTAVQIRPNGVQPHAPFSPLTYRDVCAHVRAHTPHVTDEKQMHMQTFERSDSSKYFEGDRHH